jgi:hypothetical protein
MIRYICIGGEPATGKTKLMEGIIPYLGEGYEFKYSLIRGTKHPATGVLLLGIYNVDNPFLGTDRLSMVALGDARKLADDFSQLLDTTDITVIFEGDRLFQGNFFRHLQGIPNTKFHLFILECSEEQIELRRSIRAQTGLNQDEKFLKGRRTKYKNIKNEFPHTILINDSEEQLKSNIQTILSAIHLSKRMSINAV